MDRVNLPMAAETPLRIECAFPDGALDYVCAECNAHCCRGSGFGGSLRREMGQLLKMYPAIDVQTSQRRGDCVDFETPATGCAFLRTDYRCGIEVEHGKALKPGACMLFPFNALVRSHEVIFVMPVFVCPLRVVAPVKPGAVQGTHASVIEAVRESQILDPGFVANLPESHCHPELAPAAAIARELEFRSRCASALGQARFRDVVIRESADPAALARCVSSALELLGWPAPAPSPERDAIDDLLIAIAVPTRVGLLYLPHEALLATLLLAEHAFRRSLTYARTPPTLRDVSAVLDNALPAFALLGLDDTAVELNVGKKLSTPPYGQPDMVLAAYVAMRQMKSGVRTALREALTPALSSADRFTLMRDLGRVVDEHLAHRASRRASKRSRRA